jgi:hypothetical protein
MSPTDISPVAALVRQITLVRNPHNHTPTRFNLLAGDMCYASPSGDAVAIINPDGKGGTQPGDTNEPAPPANSGGWDDFDPYVWTSYLSSLGYGGHAKRLDLPKNGPSKCPSVYSFSYSNVGVISVDVGADAKTEVGPYVSQKDFTDHYESIEWSQARYRDYAFIALDVVPAHKGGTSSMTLRAINERGVEFDRVGFKRATKF